MKNKHKKLTTLKIDIFFELSEGREFATTRLPIFKNFFLISKSLKVIIENFRKKMYLKHVFLLLALSIHLANSDFVCTTTGNFGNILLFSFKCTSHTSLSVLTINSTKKFTKPLKVRWGFILFFHILKRGG